jgi:hypothetical protein
LTSGWPLALWILPLSMSPRRRIISTLDQVRSTYTGSSCCTVASSVAVDACTYAPSVTLARPMRPATGAVTVV